MTIPQCMWAPGHLHFWLVDCFCVSKQRASWVLCAHMCVCCARSGHGIKCECPKSWSPRSLHALSVCGAYSVCVCVCEAWLVSPEECAAAGCWGLGEGVGCCLVSNCCSVWRRQELGYISERKLYSALPWPDHYLSVGERNTNSSHRQQACFVSYWPRLQPRLPPPRLQPPRH